MAGGKRRSSGNSNFDVYISPMGSDETGDGTYEKPWYTFKHIPNNALVGLLPGIYDTADYGMVFNSTWVNYHGLFATPGSTVGSGINNSVRESNNGNLLRTIDEPDYINAHGIQVGSTFAATDGPGTVLIKYKNTGSARDCPLFAGYNFLFQDIDFEYDVSPKNTNYQVSLVRVSPNVMVTNGEINVTGYFSLNYHNGGTAGDAVIYKDIHFTGSRTLLANYSGHRTLINITYD